MPRRLIVANPLTYTNANLRCEILKLLSLQPNDIGKTTVELAQRLRARLALVEKEVRILHGEYGLIWISSFYKEPGRQHGPSSRRYSFSRDGAFCHVDVPHPAAVYANCFARPHHGNSKWPEVVDYLRKRIKQGKMPTYKEVQADLNVSIATIGKAKAYIRLQQHAALKGQK